MKLRNLIYSLFLFAVCISPALPCFSAENKTALFPVQKDGKWGFIDIKGATVIPPQFKGAMPFSEGFAIVGTGLADKPYACIDTTGKVVFYLDPNWTYMNSFSEGLSCLKDTVVDKYGYIDTTGKVAIPFQFSAASSFSGGLAAVELSADSGLSYGFINKKGVLAIPADNNMKFSFSDGLASVRVWGIDGKASYGFMDSTGKMVIPAKYKKVGKFSEGLAFVWDGEKLEIINKSGAVVALLPYKVGDNDNMPAFSCGYAAPPISWRPKDAKEWGFLNKKGQLSFTDLGFWSIRTGFSEGLAWVYFRETGEGACIDTDGKILFKVNGLDEVKEFSGGAAAVKIKGQPGFSYFNRAGNIIWK